MILDHYAKRRAIQVRDMHLGGRTCPECPPSPEAGRCECWAAWVQVIHRIGAGRHLVRSGS